MVKFWRAHWWTRWSGVLLWPAFLVCCTVQSDWGVLVTYVLVMWWSFVCLCALVKPLTDEEKYHQAQALRQRQRPWEYHERIEQPHHQEGTDHGTNRRP